MDRLVFAGDALLLFGLISGVLSCFAYWPYIRDTLAGHTKPQRASWLVWAIMASVSLASQIAGGATQSLWFSGVQATATIVIFAMAVRKGQGHYGGLGDALILVGAGCGLALWSITHEPAFALFIGIGVSVIGSLPTIVKAYRSPYSETAQTWLISAFAAGLACCAVGALDVVLLAYPVYLLTMSTAICVAIALGRARTVRHAPAKPTATLLILAEDGHTFVRHSLPFSSK